MSNSGPAQDGNKGNWRETFQVRAGVILLLVAFWAALAGAKLLHMTVYQRGRTLLAAEGKIWWTGVLPAARGRLLDRNGIPLAWTERQFCLEYSVAATGEQIWDDMHALGDRLDLSPGKLRLYVSEMGGDRVIMKRGLSPKEILRLEPLLSAGSRWRVISRFIRRYRAMDPRIRKLLGMTRQFGQKEVGLTGWEAKHNEELMGRDGKYRVMVDQTGNWIFDTWTEVRKPRPGYDVYLRFAIDSRASVME